MESVLASKGVKEKRYQDILKSNLYTLVSCISADGRTLFLVLIFKDQIFRNPSLYLPREWPTPQDKIDQYPIYLVTSKSGYMCRELWMETMNIFVTEAQNRQGLGHSDQALLFLDGCSSHVKDDTIAFLKDHNIISIYFPSNTSHIVQPCDDKVFANFKAEMNRIRNNTAARCTVTDEDQNKFALFDCIKAYQKAVSKSVIIASFKDRGICPFDTSKILANDLGLVPTSNVFSVCEDFHDSIFRNVIVSIINDVSKNPVIVDRMQLPPVNKPVLIGNLENWKDGRTSRPNQVEGAAHISMEINDLQDYDEDQIFEPDNDDPAFGKLTTFPPSATCVHCHRQPKGNGAKRACFDCNLYHLCTHCYNTTDALLEHMKTHGTVTKRRTRQRDERENLILPKSNGI